MGQAEVWGCPSSCISWQSLAISLHYSHVPCTDHMEEWILQHEDTWPKYVYGLRDFVLGSPDHSLYIEWFLEWFVETYNPEAGNAAAMYEYIVVSNGFWNALIDLNFTIMESIPHPQGLKYCDFSTSFEIINILTVDVCNAEHRFTSIRLLCPVACK